MCGLMDESATVRLLFSVVVKNGIEAMGGLMCGLMDESATVRFLFTNIT